MIIPESIVNSTKKSAIDLAEIQASISQHLNRACQLLETMAYPCQDFPEYRDSCKAHLAEAASLIQGQFSNLAPCIDTTFRDSFESIASQREYQNVDKELIEGQVIYVPWDGPAPDMFCPARYIYRHEQENVGPNTMDIVQSLVRPGDDGMTDVNFIFVNTIYTKRIIEERGNLGPYERALDVVVPKLREIEELLGNLYQVREFLDNSDLAAFHAGNGSDDPAIRDRVGKCMALYTANLCSLADKVKACTEECLIQAYCMTAIRSTSEVIDKAWKVYTEFVGGARF